MAKSNLAIRLLTVGVVAPVLLATLFFGPPWAWFVFVGLAILVGASELFGMTHPGDPVAQGIGIATTGVVTTVLYVESTNALGSQRSTRIPQCV